MLRASEEERAATSDSKSKDDRCDCTHHISNCLLDISDILLHSLQGILIRTYACVIHSGGAELIDTAILQPQTNQTIDVIVIIV